MPHGTTLDHSLILVSFPPIRNHILSHALSPRSKDTKYLPLPLSLSSQTVLDRAETMAASLQAATTALRQPKLPIRSVSQLRSSHGVSRAFGVDPAAGRLTCSLKSDVKDLAHKLVDAAKLAGFALATSALVVSVSIGITFHSLITLTIWRTSHKHVVTVN